MWLQCTSWARAASVCTICIFGICFAFMCHFMFFVLMRMFALSGIHWQRMTFGFVPRAMVEAAQRQSVSNMLEVRV